MRKRILVTLAIIPIIIFATGCGIFGGSEPETTPASGTTPGTLAAISELQNALVKLDARVATLESNNPADTTALQADLAKLRSDFDALVATTTTQGTKITELESTIATLNARIAALEPTATATETTCRWSSEVYNLNHLNLLSDGVTPEVRIDYTLNPSKVQEADDYKIYLDIYNNTTTAINDLQIEICFTPKTGANVIVDEDEIFLDTTVSPYYVWDTDITTRSDGTCRRITFDTDLVKVPKGTTVDSTFTPGLTSLKLVFTLAYK